jgi:hypothetical protein
MVSPQDNIWLCSGEKEELKYEVILAKEKTK